MKLVTVVVLLLLAVSLGAQTSNVGSNAAGNAFDELYEVAPECRNTVVYSTTLGPAHDTAVASLTQRITVMTAEFRLLATSMMADLRSCQK